MRFEYLVMGYIILVVGRFYLRAIRDEIGAWRRNSALKCAPTGGVPFFTHRQVPTAFHHQQNHIFCAGAAFTPASASAPRGPDRNAPPRQRAA